MRIRLTGFPPPDDVEEFDARLFRVGEVYDLSPTFASALLISGSAELASPFPKDTAADDRLSKARKLPASDTAPSSKR